MAVAVAAAAAGLVGDQAGRAETSPSFSQVLLEPRPPQIIAREEALRQLPDRIEAMRRRHARRATAAVGAVRRYEIPAPPPEIAARIAADLDRDALLAGTPE